MGTRCEVTEPADPNKPDRRSSDKSFEPVRVVSTNPAELTSLMDSVDGLYSVTTQTAAYEIDLDADSIHRRADEGETGGVQLRRDTDRIDLLELLECTVGTRMVLLIDLRVPGVDVTTRLSTRVASISRLNRDERW